MIHKLENDGKRKDFFPSKQKELYNCDEEKETAYKKLNKLINIFESLRGIIILLVTIFIVVALVWHFLGHTVFSLGNMVAIIVVIWTFTLTLSMYWIGKLEQRNYGIRTLDVILMDLGYKKIVYLASIVIGEILLLIVAVIVDCFYLLILDTVIQLYMMIYILILVLLKTSFTSIKYKIREELEYILTDQEIVKIDAAIVVNGTMFGSMLKNMDYSDVEELKRLQDILRECIPSILRERMNTSRNENKENSLLLKEINWQIDFCAEITSYIVNGVKVNEKVVEILMEWIYDKGTYYEMCQGVLKAIMDNMTPEAEMICERLLVVVSEEWRRLYIWYIVYNLYRKEYYSEYYRIYYARIMAFKINRCWQQKDIECILHYVEQLTGKRNDSGLILNYIWDWEGK